MFGFLAPILGGLGKLLVGSLAPTAAVGSAVGAGLGKQILGSVATSLIGGIGQRAQAKAERGQSLQDQRLQFQRLRDAAELGGFNPLTALRANPSGGMPNPTPALSSGSFVADALGAGAQTYFNGDTMKRDAERDALEKALMRQELSNMQAQGKAFTRSMSFGYEIPNSNNYSGVDRVQSLPALASSPPPSRPAGGGLRVAGVDVLNNPNFSDAQKIEDRYGDVASWIYGLGTVAADAYSTAGKFNVPFLSDPWSDAKRAGVPYRSPASQPKQYQRFNPNHRDGYYYP